MDYWGCSDALSDTIRYVDYVCNTTHSFLFVRTGSLLLQLYGVVLSSFYRLIFTYLSTEFVFFYGVILPNILCLKMCYSIKKIHVAFDCLL